MIIFKKKTFFIPVRETWYGIRTGFPDFFLCCVYFNVPPSAQLPKYLLSFPGKTIVISLNGTNGEIFSAFSKQTRNAVRQAEKLKMEVVFDLQIPTFISFYNLFAARKNLSRLTPSYFDHLDGAYQLCQVLYNGEVCAMHFYIMDKASGQVQLFRSASRRVFDASIEKNIVGKANKYLHYRAIIFFKELQFAAYDFGGFSHKNDRNYARFLGVNRFKKSFGGVELHYTNYATFLYMILKYFAGKLR